jgi:hypothetical protein
MTWGICTINHLRPRVFELWCAQIKRLRYDFDCYIPAVCVADMDEKETCDRYNIVHFFSANYPVSIKWNIGFKYFWSLGCDYVMILGSDNIISTQLMRNVVEQMEKGISLIGIDCIYFYAGDGKDRGKLIKMQTKQILGVAKTISKDVLDAVAWKPFPQEKNWGIDAICSKTIAPYVTTKSIIEGLCVDVKTRDNLNKFSCFGNRYEIINPDVFYNILSEEEKTLLAKL